MRLMSYIGSKKHPLELEVQHMTSMGIGADMHVLLQFVNQSKNMRGKIYKPREGVLPGGLCYDWKMY